MTSCAPYTPRQTRYARAWWLALCALLGCQTSPLRHPPGVATLAVVGSIEATVAPCGCTSRPLGGLDRLAFAIGEAQKQAPTLTLVVGNTFFAAPSCSSAMAGQSRATAKVIAEILSGIGELRLSPGPFDRGPQAGALEEAPPRMRRALGTEPSAEGLTCESLRLGDLRLGLMSVDARRLAAVTPEQLGSAAASLRKDGAEVVVVLWPTDVAAAQAQLTGLPGSIDVVVASNSGARRPPTLLGATAMLIDAGARGEDVSLLHFRKGEGGRFAWFDGGKQALDDATARITRLRQEAQRLPEGGGRQAREARADKLEHEMASLQQPEPSTATFRLESRPMDMHLPQAPWATQALNRFNGALCDIAKADTARRVCPEPATVADTYVGSAACQSCHPQAWSVWQKTQHARAWSTLTTANKACDLTCVGCHVVGFEKPGGFCHLADAPKWANVGCESCHGPGKGHVQNPYERAGWSKNFVRDTPEATCKGCHNATHSDMFDFHSYRPKILGPGHGLPSEPQR